MMDEKESIIPVIAEEDIDTEILSHSQPVIMCFFAEWCSWCKKMQPVMEKLYHQYGDSVIFRRFDINRSDSVIQKYSIISVPVILFFKDGKESGRLTGYSSEEDISKKIDKLI